MVTLETAEKALKSVYLGVVANQLNVGVNPFYTMIKQTSSDVWGKEIIKLVPYGVNGGVGAGTETGSLPAAAPNNYERFKLELKNLYGTIELSDKAIRASQSSAGAFVNLLVAVMEGLLQASKFNLGRMPYGDGSGVIATATTNGSANNIFVVDSVKRLVEGMVIDGYDDDGAAVSAVTGVRITSIDRGSKTVTVSGSGCAITTGKTVTFTVQGSKDNEITGLGAIFSDNDIYGVSRTGKKYLQALTEPRVGALDTEKMQLAIDTIDEYTSSVTDIILCSYDSRRAYLDACALQRTNVDYMNLDGGFKALSFNGIPVVADRFIDDGEMYFLNSKDFKLHQLCDWRWLEGDNGKIIRQNAGSATYTATLVKYADLICDRPMAQFKYSGVTS